MVAPVRTKPPCVNILTADPDPKNRGYQPRIGLLASGEVTAGSFTAHSGNPAELLSAAPQG